jgi:hypothetical protein
MLIIRCSACRKKLFRYRKLGKGEVLRCHKSRIERTWDNWSLSEGKLTCKCGAVIAHDKDLHYRMVSKAFTYSGTKEPKK